VIDTVWIVLAAFLLDLLLGDPRWFPHPVRGMGWLAARLETILRPSPMPLKVSGAVVAVLVVGISGAVAWLLVAGASALHPYAGSFVSVVLLWSCFASRDLADHARAVLSPLLSGDLEEARHKVSWMVGRDTDELDMRGFHLLQLKALRRIRLMELRHRCSMPFCLALWVRWCLKQRVRLIHRSGIKTSNTWSLAGLRLGWMMC